MDINKITALMLGKAIKLGEISATEAAKESIRRIKNTNPEINSFITVCEERAIKCAAEIEQGIKSGKYTSSLAGVPVAVKDNICTAGIRTTCASKMLDNFLPPYNAAVVEKLEQAGCNIIGKLNMDEFAMGSTGETSYYGAAKNPHDLSRVTGGSSSGAAAAVAAGQVTAALGSDTGGSIRQPAAYCGVTGFKPTYGAVSRHGLIAYASSLDQIGPVARDAADCAALTDIIKGQDRMDSTSVDIGSLLSDSLSGGIKGMKIGIPDECFGADLNTDTADTVLKMAETLKDLGAELVSVSLSFLQLVVPAYYIIAAAEASSNLSRFDGIKYGFHAEKFETVEELICNTRNEGFGEEVKKRILLGTFVLSSGYYDTFYGKAQQAKALITEGFRAAFERCDLILCPTAPDTAPHLNESLSDSLKMYLSDIYTVPVNLAGLPGLSVPCGMDKNSMPVGGQLIGPRFSDATVLRAGYAYQQVTAWHKEFTEVTV